MRPLEILLLLIGCAALARPLLPAGLRARTALVLPGVAVLVLVAHVAIEGARWQLGPAYALIAVVAVWGLVRRGRSTGLSRRLAAPLVVVGALCLGAAGAAATLIPVVGFPAPTGPLPIGTVTFHWVDASRPEPVTPDPDDVREVMVQVWYPAEPVPGASPAPYMEHIDIAGPEIATGLGLPPFFLDHTALLHGHAIPGAPIAAGQDRYPVLVFSHGNTGVRTQNTVQFEELASHGYVIASIDHTYNAGVTVFPDERVVLYDRDGIQYLKSTPESERRHAERVAFRAADVSFVLDQLERADAGELTSPFAGRLDFGRVGMFGHSYGGATATQAAYSDARIRAAIDLDGWPWGEVVEHGLAKPYLYMAATVSFRASDETLAKAGVTREERDAHNAWHNAQVKRLVADSPAPAYLLTIEGMAHYNFTDIPLLSPLTTPLGLTGPIDGARGLAIINAYTLQFFDHYLRGRPAPLLEGPAPEYPEVTFLARAPDHTS